jgi:hypothetical protein
MKMRVYDITLDCDHKLLVIAPSADQAGRIAAREAGPHHAIVEEVTEVALAEAGLLAWYPGPFSTDAVTDEEES